MTQPITIQVSRTANGITIKILTEGTFTSFAIYEKKDAVPTIIPAELIATISGTVKSYDITTSGKASGVWYYQVVGTFVDKTVSSTVDFMLVDSVIGYRNELKVAIFNKLKLNASLTAVVSTRIYAGFPQSLTDYPCVVFWLDELSMPDPDRQHYEAPTLRVKVFARSQSDMDKICDYVNQILINYAYQGKEAVIYSTKKFSETGTQLEADGQTLSVDMFFRLTTERLTLPTSL